MKTKTIDMPTNGIKDLSTLLRNTQPQLQEGVFVFVTTTDPGAVPDDWPIASIREKEGISLVLTKDQADELRLPYAFEAAWITLNVHSDLEAVGLTAAFATALAKAGISCNVIAGYYHDHIFVGRGQAEMAMEILRALEKPG